MQTPPVSAPDAPRGYEIPERPIHRDVVAVGLVALAGAAVGWGAAEALESVMPSHLMPFVPLPESLPLQFKLGSAALAGLTGALGATAKAVSDRMKAAGAGIESAIFS